MSDIVERLRGVRRSMEQGKALFADQLEFLTWDAADEIERLRGLLREATFRLRDDDLLARIDAALAADEATVTTPRENEGP